MPSQKLKFHLKINLSRRIRSRILVKITSTKALNLFVLFGDFVSAHGTSSNWKGLWKRLENILEKRANNPTLEFSSDLSKCMFYSRYRKQQNFLLNLEMRVFSFLALEKSIAKTLYKEENLTDERQVCSFYLCNFGFYCCSCLCFNLKRSLSNVGNQLCI